MNRVEHLEGVGHENGEGAYLHQPLKREPAALPEDQSQHHSGHHRHGRDEEGGKMGFPDGHAAHSGSLFLEIADHLFFHAQHLDRLRACDALVVVARDLRIDLADLSVVVKQHPLEIHHENDSDRDEQANERRQPHVNYQHHDEDADHIGAVPHKVHHSPGDHFTDEAGVRHDPRVNVADGVAVEIGEGQRLNVVERVVSEVLVHRHFHLAALHGAHVIDDSLDDEQRYVKTGEGPDPREGHTADEVIQGVAVEQRVGSVHPAGYRAEQDHANDFYSIRF